MILAYSRFRSERGFSLTELAVYIVLLGLIAAIVVTVVLSLFRSEDTVSGITNSTSESQVAVTFLQSDIRNAREFQSSSDGRTLTASVANSGATESWSCVRWTVTGTGTTQNLNRAVKDSTWPTPTTLLTGVRPKGSAPFFSGTTAMGAQGLVKYAMQVATVNNGVIDVVGSVSNTAQGSGTDSNCFG